MVSIDYDKLNEVSVALKKLYEMVQYNLEGSKLEYNSICITPLEALMCPQIGDLEDDMDKLQSRGNEALEDIQELITGIHNVINKFQESESKIARDINAATVSSSLLDGAEILSPTALMMLGRGSIIQGTESKKGFNSDNYNENCLSSWDAAVGAKVTSGLVAASDRKIAIGIEKEYGAGLKISANQRDKNLSTMGYNRGYRRNYLRKLSHEERNIKKFIPKRKILGKSLGFLTVGLTALSVVDDFDNNKTVPQKFEASSVDVGMTAFGYAASTGAIAVVGGICAIAAAPEIVTVVASVIAVGIVGALVNAATSEVKSVWNLR